MRRTLMLALVVLTGCDGTMEGGATGGGSGAAGGGDLGTAGGGGTATAGGGNTATAGGGSTATAGGGSTATAGGGSTATAGGGSTANAGGGSTATAGGSSTATAGGGGMGTAGGSMPSTTTPCTPNGQCVWPETSSTCPQDCGSSDVASFTQQRAKYIDRACALNGNGLADTCATSPGGAGRFNELQAAISSLVGGDTLYIHPGDYWRVPTEEERDWAGIYVIETINGTAPTAQRPIIITARFVANPPTLHSWNPAIAPGSTRVNARPALAIRSSHTIADHLRIVGRIGISGTQGSRIQHCDVRFGWGLCDGNWAGIRVDGANGAVVHHNFVHDVTDDSMCNDIADRPSGLKEFSSDRTVWEFNTVRNTGYWGYDLHRDSTRSAIRYNKFENVAESSIRIARGPDSQVIGNIVVGSGQCLELEEIQPATPATDIVANNSCFFAGFSWVIDGAHANHSARLENNIAHARMGGERYNVVLGAGASRVADRNAYDSNGRFCRRLYVDEDPCEMTLAAWQATGRDPNSISATGGACTFVDAPTGPTDTTYDTHVMGGPCATLGTNGQQVGPYGVTSCVGHVCP
ncbi:MAG: right-handed parallel beta-helix repeat-containing protein [Myxococcaceae bacterium]|nr:right-handed parallel beta-helix repeat-containing protein [Myxococcaceae bacterium]